MAVRFVFACEPPCKTYENSQAQGTILNEQVMKTYVAAVRPSERGQEGSRSNIMYFYKRGGVVLQGQKIFGPEYVLVLKRPPDISYRALKKKD